MTGKKSLDMILLGLMTLVNLGIIGLFYYTEKSYKKPPIDESKEKEAFFKSHETVKAIPTLFKIDKMTVSLIPKDEQNRRMHYLELETHLVLLKSEYKETLKPYASIILDKIITITSKMGVEELNTLTGKIILEDRLRKEINQSFGKPVVKSIFFSRYTVQ